MRGHRGGIPGEGFCRIIIQPAALVLQGLRQDVYKRQPLPWINYLGSEAFFSLVSHTAGGYSFYKDAKLRRITRYRYNNVPADSNGRYYYCLLYTSQPLLGAVLGANLQDEF